MPGNPLVASSIQAVGAFASFLPSIYAKAGQAAISM